MRPSDRFTPREPKPNLLGAMYQTMRGGPERCVGRVTKRMEFCSKCGTVYKINTRRKHVCGG